MPCSNVRSAQQQRFFGLVLDLVPTRHAHPAETMHARVAENVLLRVINTVEAEMSGLGLSILLLFNSLAMCRHDDAVTERGQGGISNVSDRQLRWLRGGGGGRFAAAALTRCRPGPHREAGSLHNCNHPRVSGRATGASLIAHSCFTCSAGYRKRHRTIASSTETRQIKSREQDRRALPILPPKSSFTVSCFFFWSAEKQHPSKKSHSPEHSNSIHRQPNLIAHSHLAVEVGRETRTFRSSQSKAGCFSTGC